MQSHRLAVQYNSGLDCPFPLATMPVEFGSWKGQEQPMDPIIAQVAGSRDNVQRIYRDSTTGMAVAMLLLYGPGKAMMMHTPENCYVNGSGYQITASNDHVLEIKDQAQPAVFRQLICQNPRRRVEVYYSWRLAGRWTPNYVAFKRVERLPDVFKLQVERTLSPKELPDGSDVIPAIAEASKNLPTDPVSKNAAIEQTPKDPSIGRPCESFLHYVLASFEEKLAKATSTAKTKV